MTTTTTATLDTEDVTTTTPCVECGTTRDDNPIHCADDPDTVICGDHYDAHLTVCGDCLALVREAA